MPRYDLRCPSCGLTWEVHRGMTEPNPPCPACQQAPEQLPNTGTGFVLRGTGWGGK